MDMALPVSSLLVMAQATTCSRELGGTVRDVPARTPSVELVLGMEILTFSAPTRVLRAYAGATCALAHSCLRTLDLQRSKDFVITPDAIMATCWRMKGKKVQTPWAALRVGFSGKDWASHWLRELAEDDLPGLDFTLMAPNSKFSDYTSTIASHHHFANVQRALLTMPPISLSVRDALTFIPHSWRHVYPTAASQLSIPDSQKEE